AISRASRTSLGIVVWPVAVTLATASTVSLLPPCIPSLQHTSPYYHASLAAGEPDTGLIAAARPAPAGGNQPGFGIVWPLVSLPAADPRAGRLPAGAGWCRRSWPRWHASPARSRLAQARSRTRRRAPR